MNEPARVTARLLAKFYLRFHISLILLWSFSAGLLTTKAMLWAGVNSMLWRYPVALLASYVAFFLGVRVWLAYIGAQPFVSDREARSSLVDNLSNASKFYPGSSRGTGSGIPFRGGGGDFGGGGASGSFMEGPGSLTDAGSDPIRTASWFPWGAGSDASGKSGGSGIDLDLGDGDGWLVVLLLVLITALLGSVFGAAIFLVHSAPALLGDVAFQAMLAGGLVKSSQRWRDASWEMSLLKSTWIPFVGVLVLALITVVLAAGLFPAAHTLPEVIHAARGYLG